MSGQNDTDNASVKILMPGETEIKQGENPAILTLSKEEQAKFGKQTEEKSIKWNHFLGMTQMGIVYWLKHKPSEFLDLFAEKCEIKSWSEISAAAKKLDFTQTEFRYNKKQHVDETWHIFTEFIKDFGDLCPEEFFTFLFFTTKLGRFGADVEDIAVSDEFVESISYSLSTLPSNTEKFMNLYNVADLLVERFSKEEAAELISVLDEKKFLSGSLAQTLFYRFPELKEGYGSVDLSGVPLKEILDNLEKFEAQAMNEAETLRPLDTNVGMEIEIKLAGVEQGRSVENSALRKKIEGTKTFWDFGVDGYEEAAELRTLDEGIPLNAKTSEKLRSDVRKLEQSNDVAAFATTHINVDSRILDEESSLIGFRKFDERRMEISAVPLSTSNHGLSFDASGYIDQMMIVGAFCDILPFLNNSEMIY